MKFSELLGKGRFRNQSRMPLGGGMLMLVAKSRSHIKGQDDNKVNCGTLVMHLLLRFNEIVLGTSNLHLVPS